MTKGTAQYSEESTAAICADPPNINELKADALARQAKLTAELKRVQEIVPQLIGALNQIAGELKALEAMGAK